MHLIIYWSISIIVFIKKNMTRTSILFKPSRKSWVNNELQFMWFYEFRYNELKENDLFIKSKLKVRIDWVPYDEIARLYEAPEKYFNKEAIVILMCNITELFE